MNSGHLLGYGAVLVCLLTCNQLSGQSPRSAGPSSATPVGSSAPPQTPQLPDGVRMLKDLAYVSNGHERQKLDLYLPAGDKPVPLIIWIHGGGWEAGGKEGPKAMGLLWVGGYAVASINYRFSSQAKFPAQVEDCKAAVRWLRSHAKEYQIDPERFGVWGQSAGGYLAAFLGATGATSDFDRGENMGVSSRVQAVCDFCGPIDFSRFESIAGENALTRMIGGSLADHRDQVRQANPITHLKKPVPSFLIVHGGADELVPVNQSELLAEALRKHEGDVALHTIPGGKHDPQEQGLEQRVGDFFGRVLGGRRFPQSNSDSSNRPVAARAEPSAPQSSFPSSNQVDMPTGGRRSATVAKADRGKKSDNASSKAASHADETDDLRLLNDEFDEPQSLSNWKRIFREESWGADQLEKIDIGASTTGSLTMRPYSSVWYQDHRGELTYKNVRGDFVMTTRVKVTNRSGSGAPQSQFSLAGIMIRAPRDITPKTWRPKGENYLFLSLGAADRPGSFQFEAKTTINSQSDLSITPASANEATIRVARVGEHCLLLVKPDNGEWRVHRRYRRPDFPAELQAGLTCYTDWPTCKAMGAQQHNGTVIKSGHPDLLAQFEFVHYQRPHLPDRLIGRPLSDPNAVTDRELVDELGDSLK